MCVPAFLISTFGVKITLRLVIRSLLTFDTSATAIERKPKRIVPNPGTSTE